MSTIVEGRDRGDRFVKKLDQDYFEWLKRFVRAFYQLRS